MKKDLLVVSSATPWKVLLMWHRDDHCCVMVLSYRVYLKDFLSNQELVMLTNGMQAGV